MKTLSDFLIPDIICDTVRQVPFASFVEKGVRVIAFDIDNTLVPYDVPSADQELQDFLFSLKNLGVKIAFVSNNTPQRVSLFNEPFGFFTVPDAHKPLRSALKPVITHFGVKPKEVLLVGDQLLTDVLSARIWGAFAATVLPIKKVESRFFRFKRKLEKPFVKKYYKRQGK